MQTLESEYEARLEGCERRLDRYAAMIERLRAYIRELEQKLHDQRSRNR